MKLLIVRYERERAHHDPEQAAGFRQAAEKIAGVPGLVMTPSDDQRSRRGYASNSRAPPRHPACADPCSGEHEPRESQAS